MSVIKAINAPLFDPPDDEAVNRAIEDYARLVRDAYGSRLKGIYLFGSRARGDHTAESDADIAVVLDDGDWSYWQEMFRLADIEYDIVVETGADVEGWPVRASEWLDPATHSNPDLILAMQEDRKLIGAADG